MNRRIFLAPLLFTPQVLRTSMQQIPDSFKISVNVDLVVLHATVRDRKGVAPAALRQQDFEIYEDGVRQTIRLFQHEDVPVTVGLVVDHSGSMHRKIGEVITAARTFAQSSRADDEMFVVNFNEYVTLGLPASMPFTNRPEALEAAIQKDGVTGKTALYDAVLRAFERLRSGGKDKKVLVVISDGGDNASTHKLSEVLQTAGEASTVVYTIGLFDNEDMDRNPDMLRSLARATGGEAYFPKALSDVVTICARIAYDIRNQYTLGYFSTQRAQPGAKHGVRVTAGTKETGSLVVRARSAYITGSAK